MGYLVTRRTAIAMGLACWTTPGWARPRQYDLIKDSSSVTFNFVLNGTVQSGQVPITSADIRVDPDDLQSSTADVSADIRAAKTGLVFITQALLSASILDAETHPLVRFTSTNIELGARGRISEGAKIAGDLTLRGVTRPIQFDARLSRPAGTPPDDLSLLFVDLTGSVQRSAFGANGFPKLVQDTVTLEIHAEIQARA